MRSIFAAVAALCLLAGSAFAQVAPDTTVTLGEDLAAYAEAIAAAAIAVAGFMIRAYVKNMFLRQGLHLALSQAAGLLVQRAGDSVRGRKLDLRNQHVATAIDYVQRNAPDALAKWGITPETVAEKIEGKLGQLIAPGGIIDANRDTPSPRSPGIAERPPVRSGG